MSNRAFAEAMIQGDGNVSIFSFRIPTYNLSKEFDWESPLQAYVGDDSQSVSKFFEIIKETIAVAKESLEIKRKANMESYPYTRFYLESVYQRAKSYRANHSSMIGVIGMNDACSILLGRGVYHNNDFAGSLLQFIKDELQEIRD
ncbi:hypothetical protein DVH05_000225 [Phytophthora capsici]|nr:hypothetical protein DVH05_000225 [Phytophthora capsici]|eukprot:jgi/Phyca11/21460/fgenesh1_pg.PHYCAscaffold_96_\